jgi:preprotein translocase subunit YajC
MDEFWMLLKSWIPFVVLMAIWFLFLRRPLMRRLTDWARARKK